MATQTSPPSWLILISLTCALLIISCIRASDGDQKIYIVYMGDRPKGDIFASSLHTSMLQEAVGRASESLLYSYKRSFNGFVAKLTEEEKEKIASLEGVVSVFPNKKETLHTTASWDFINFPIGVARSEVESDIIVGVFDTGIWPESESFNDAGIGPPPKKWKGSCQSSTNVTCNNKIIGAKYYHTLGPIPAEDFHSPRDLDGHGTHTASIAAGRLVSGASLLGLGMGTARGGVPSARIAVYKICWTDHCQQADILAAFDDAIADGVDVISISVGGARYNSYLQDARAIGAFYAMKKGILTSNSAGNSGPYLGSVGSNAPWMLSVAASTTNRKFVAGVQLGNNRSYVGVSVNTFELNHQYPLVYAGDVPNTRAGFNRSYSRFCYFKNSLDPTLVNGTIVLCDLETNGTVAFHAGAIGTIMAGNGFKDVGRTFPLAASYLDKKDGDGVYEYYKNSTGKPTATIMRSIETKDELAPYVASFSSRGPNPITSDILKPDLTAPGVDILAAWSQATTVTGIEGDRRVVPYNIISGTSMACPHASGAAVYVKSFNPGWSPAAIKSALMTTARPMGVINNPDAELAYGAGHIDPVRAAKPGLVYDAGVLDYVKFLCGQGYDTKLIQILTGDNSSCSEANNGTVWDLNYPTFALSVQSVKPITRVFHRTVTNVGSPVSTYNAIVVNHAGLDIQVEPSVLSFNSIGQKQSFVVTITATIDNNVLSGSLVWDDGVHKVRSSIVAYPSFSEGQK